MPQTLTPTNEAALAVYACGRSVAGSETFQALTGQEDIEQAWSGHVHLFEANDLTGKRLAPLPRAIVAWERFRRDRVATGTFRCTGSLLITFELLAPPEYADGRNDAAAWVLEKTDAIIQEMHVLGEQGGTYLNMIGAELVDFGQRMPEEGNAVEDQYAWIAVWQVEWP